MKEKILQHLYTSARKIHNSTFCHLTVTDIQPCLMIMYNSEHLKLLKLTNVLKEILFLSNFHTLFIYIYINN